MSKNLLFLLKMYVSDVRLPLKYVSEITNETLICIENTICLKENGEQCQKCIKADIVWGNETSIVIYPKYIHQEQ